MKIIAYAFLAAFLAVIAAQNSTLVEMSFVFLSWRVPLNYIVLASAAAGFAAGALLFFPLSRRGIKGNTAPGGDNAEKKQD